MRARSAGEGRATATASRSSLTRHSARPQDARTSFTANHEPRETRDNDGCLSCRLAHGPAPIPEVSAFFSPALKKPIKKRWITVADDVSTLDVDTPIKVDFVEAANDVRVESRALRTVWLYTEDGEKFTAYNGVCTHLGCSYTFDAEKKRYQ